MEILDAAQRAGAEWADVRIITKRLQSIATRNSEVSGLRDTVTSGFGLRVLVGGSWGFSGSRKTTPEAVEAVARRAVAQARAHAAIQKRPVELSDEEVVSDGRWESPMEIDPFEVPLEEKIDFLIRANRVALSERQVRTVTSTMEFLLDEKLYANSEGTVTDQVIRWAEPIMLVTAVSDDRSESQTRWSRADIPPLGIGYEHIIDSDLIGNAPRYAQEAVQKLSAASVEPGLYDLVLLPTHLGLTLHETIGHPTELDRIMGYEADHAGTSFIYPIEEYLGRFRYGPDFMNVQGERSVPGGMANAGWDDEGVKPRDYLIVKDGILNDLQTTREQAPWLADWYSSQGKEVRSNGNAYGENWDVVQFQRMPNINLLPYPGRDVTVEELVSGVERGIMIDGRGSFSIDQQRYNAQFGGQIFWEIRDGRITRMLKDVAYQIRTPEFWNSMDLCGGESTYHMYGSTGGGKGQPSQGKDVTHGGPATRHRGVSVINTAELV